MTFFNYIMQNPLMQKLAKYSGLALLAGLFIAFMRKDAADDKQIEMQLEDAQLEIDLLKEAKEIENKIDAMPDDVKRDRLRSFFNKNK